MSWHLAGQLLLPLGQLPAGSCGKVGDGPYTWPCQLCWETGMQCPASRLSLAQSDLLWLSGELTSKWKTISSLFSCHSRCHSAFQINHLKKMQQIDL